MKTRLLAVFAVALGLAAAGVLSAADKEFKATCPVSGAPAKEANALDYKGKKVYFCCQNCPKKYAADPEKFATKANFQLAQTGQVTQVACPLSGKPCNPDATTDVKGVAVAFC